MVHVRCGCRNRQQIDRAHDAAGCRTRFVGKNSPVLIARAYGAKLQLKAACVLL